MTLTVVLLWLQSPNAGAQLRQRFEGQLAEQGLPADSWAAEWQKEVEALQCAEGFSDKWVFCLLLSADGRDTGCNTHLRISHK